MTYNGSEQTPSATVTVDGLTVTGQWSTVKNVWDTTTFTATGNFTGSIGPVNPGMQKKTIAATVVAADKCWDGTNTAVVTVTLETDVDGETITVSGITGTFASADIGEDITVTLDKNDISYSGASTANYSFTIADTTTAEINIIPLTISGVTMNAASYTYGGDPVGYVTPDAPFTQPGGTAAAVGNLVYTYTDTANDGTTYENTKAPTKAGSYTLTVSYSDTEHYEVTVQKINFIIEKADPNVTPPTEKTGLVYNGQLQELVTAGSTDGGTLVYSVNGRDWSETLPEAKEAGNYAIAYYVIGDKNYHGTGTQALPTVIIEKAEVEEPAQADPVTYNGQAQTYAVGSNEYYTVEAVTETDAGSYDVTISLKDKDNYKWKNAGDSEALTHTFTINRASVTVTAIDQSYYIGIIIPDSFEEGRHYTIDGLIGEDTLGNVTLKYRKNGADVTPDRSKAGTYDIVPVVTDANSNYDITVVKGSLTVKKATYIPIDFPVLNSDTVCDGYTDLDVNAWSHDGIHFCLENGLMIGTDADTFAPSMTTSRAMIVTMLWRLEGEPVVDYAMSFEDVAAGAWYAEAVRWAASEGIVLGYSDKAFGPNDVITREQLAVILYRYEQYKGGGFTGMWMFDMDYVDAAEVSDWAYEAMCWMNMNGIVNGKPGNVLDPKGSATRAETAAMIQRYCGVMTK